jgi:hypothetical protein
VDSTPILDRRIPFPPAEVAKSIHSEHGSPFYGVLIAGGFLVGLVIAWVYRVGDWVWQWFSVTLPDWPLTIRLAAVGVAAVTGLLAALVVHELGHVLAGLSLGFRFHSVRVGRLHLTRPFRWSWSRPAEPAAAGMTTLFPVGTTALGPRAFGMLVGGPVANLATAGVITVLAFEKDLFWASFVLWCVMIGMGNLVPFRRGSFVSDGGRIVTLVADPTRARRWLAMIALTTELHDGVPPESLSPEFIATAIAECDESAETVAAHLLAYLTRFHQHDDARAADALEICLSYAGHLPEAIRESLMCEAAVFQARRRGRADLAEAWLEDVPAATAIPGNREHAEAAILEARGDREGARRTLDDAEVLLHARPEAPLRDLSLRLLRRWKADLERA